MEFIKTNGREFRYVNNVKRDVVLRKAFNQLTREVYGFDFENWYNSGYWGENYVPHALMDEERMVSNISASEIVFSVDDQKRTCIQIGTVMTHPDYRNQGLNRVLMDKVFARWRGNCDLIYLFANDTVLNFYPKFGFTPVQEYQHSTRVLPEETILEKQTPHLKKLDMADSRNQALVFNIVNASQPMSLVSMQGNASLVLFWLSNWYADFVYYSDASDAIVVLQYQENQLLLMDAWSKQDLALGDLLSTLVTPDIDTVVLGFTPLKPAAFTVELLKPDDQLFVLDDRYGIAKSQQFMFPLLSHA